MKTMNIMIQNQEDVCDFVSRISEFPYDVNLVNGRFVIDAKSILGVLGLGVGKVLKMEANTDDMTALRQALGKYAVA